jgi:hypothetical protein
VLDAAVTQHFLGEKKTAKGLLDAVEGRVATSSSRADMQGADHGSRDVLERTRRQLKVMERQMGWSPDRVRRVLERATVRTRGTVASAGPLPRISFSNTPGLMLRALIRPREIFGVECRSRG